MNRLRFTTTRGVSRNAMIPAPMARRAQARHPLRAKVVAGRAREMSRPQRLAMSLPLGPVERSEMHTRTPFGEDGAQYVEHVDDLGHDGFSLWRSAPEARVVVRRT